MDPSIIRPEALISQEDAERLLGIDVEFDPMRNDYLDPTEPGQVYTGYKFEGAMPLDGFGVRLYQDTALDLSRGTCVRAAKGPHII